jgi:3-phosphoshikimate 1-carboxyvinyltransferase
MTERPIKVLVETRAIGSKISYEKRSGLSAYSNQRSKNKPSKVTIAANVSSQYISALLLVAAKLENGIELTLDGEITSIPEAAHENAQRHRQLSCHGMMVP